MVYKITDLHSKPRKIKINSFMQWIKVGRIWSWGTVQWSYHDYSSEQGKQAEGARILP